MSDQGERAPARRPVRTIIWVALSVVLLTFAAGAAFLFMPTGGRMRAVSAVAARADNDQQRFALLEQNYDARVLRAPGVPGEVWSVPTAKDRDFQTDMAIQAALARTPYGLTPEQLEELVGAPALAPVDSATLDAAQERALSQAQAGDRARPRVLRWRQNASQVEAQTALPRPFAIQLDAQHTLALMPQDVHVSDGGVVWRGAVTGGGDALLFMQGDTIAGFVRSQGETYALRALGGGLEALAPTSTRSKPEEERPEFETEAPKAPPADAEDNPPGLSEISVLVAYTPQASAAFPDVTRDYIKPAIAFTNDSFRSSGLASIVQVNLVGARAVTYGETGAWKQHLDRLVAPDDGVMDELQLARRDAHADIVILLVKDPTHCGEAASIGPIQARAFALVSIYCGLDNFSLTHEIGHLFGLRHDIDHDYSTYPLGHGFLLPACLVRSLMAYQTQCPLCERIDRWSDPNAKYCGRPFGTQEHEFEVSVITQTAHAISLFGEQ